MLCDPSGYLGFEIPYGRAADVMDRDRGNLQEKVERSRREGKPLSPKLERDIFMAVYVLQEEIPLHSYPRRTMTLMRQLRNYEVEARNRISEFDGSGYNDKYEAADALHKLFTFNASLMGDLFYVYVREAFAAAEKETISADEKCSLYCAAAFLQTLVDIWDEAASLMKKLDAGQDGRLSFEFLEFEELVTVMDVAEKAFDFYKELEFFLKAEMTATSDERERSRLQKDCDIVATNMVMITSYGFDWMKAKADFVDIICPRLEAADVMNRAQALSGAGFVPLKHALELFERHPDHVVLGRNLIYMGIQQRNRAIAGSAAKRLADLLKHRVDETLKEGLAGRKSLEAEPHLDIDNEVRSWFEAEESSR